MNARSHPPHIRCSASRVANLRHPTTAAKHPRRYASILRAFGFDFAMPIVQLFRVFDGNEKQNFGAAASHVCNHPGLHMSFAGNLGCTLRSMPLGMLALLCFAQAGLTAGLKLDSREYKLMLAPAKFAGDRPEKIISRYWDEQLKPIIAQRLDRRKNGAARHKGSFALDHERSVVFRDTENCLLNGNGYALRERTKLDNGQPDNSTRELTLKFRTPDVFLADTSSIGAADDKAKIKFEEDIAPILVRRVSASGHERVAYAQPPSIRSLFSKSVRQRIKPEASIRSLQDVAALHPGLERELKKSGVDDSALAAALVSGLHIRELVFSGAVVDLGEDVDGEFDLTLWYAGGTAASQPTLAELSFKYDTDKGDVAEPVARRALVLFRAMQEMPGEWTSPEHETKTSMALPEKCKT